MSTWEKLLESLQSGRPRAPLQQPSSPQAPNATTQPPPGAAAGGGGGGDPSTPRHRHGSGSSSRGAAHQQQQQRGAPPAAPRGNSPAQHHRTAVPECFIKLLNSLVRFHEGKRCFYPTDEDAPVAEAGPGWEQPTAESIRRVFDAFDDAIKERIRLLGSDED